MKKTYRYARSEGKVTCALPSGVSVALPVVPGLLKHPGTELLRALLQEPAVARKYTVEALRRAPWPVLRQFPPDWLRECLDDADLNPRRRAALLFLLS
jgi:hypothetical protein